MLETIYYVGQTLAVIAILATLIVLIVQIRQSNKLARTEMSLKTWLPSIEKYYDVLANDDDSKFFYKAFYTDERLADSERIRFVHYAAFSVNAFEAMFLLDKEGLCNKTLLFRHAEGLESLFVSARMRKWWANTREHYFTPEFRQFIDELVDKTVQRRVNTP